MDKTLYAGFNVRYAKVDTVATVDAWNKPFEIEILGLTEVKIPAAPFGSISADILFVQKLIEVVKE